MATVTSHEKIQTYSVVQLGNADLTITGRGDDPRWAKAKPLSEFLYPWDTGTPPATTFKALHNDDWLYCLYEVVDHHIKIQVIKNDKWEVASSDRVEIFFRKDAQLAPYYCLEIDPKARVLDYEAQYHRKFNIGWSWPSGHLNIKTSLTADGYTVEVAISKASLKQLGLLKDNKLEAGIYRAECTALTETDTEMKWISWLKPASETPDFHIASSFGTLILEP